MNTLPTQFKWQVTLLQKNNIISISLAITLIYGVILYFLKHIGNLDKVVVVLVLNDPATIGYFFIALGIYTEMKQEVLPALFVTPVNIHHLLIAKILSISCVGTTCSLGLAISAKGLGFDILNYTIGTMGICLLSSLMGLAMLTFASEFIKFALISVPIFMTFMVIPIIQYLGLINFGGAKYLFPLQGSIDLIDYAISGTVINFWYAYISIIILTPIFYWIAFQLFNKKIVHK